MKTIEELYNEVMSSDELKKEFCALKPEEVEGFAAKHGCKATLDEIKAFLAEKSKTSGELSDAEIEQAAGGKSASLMEALVSEKRKIWYNRNKEKSRTGEENGTDNIQRYGIR